MQNRLSSEAYWFGYKLLVEPVSEFDNPEANGWRARVVKPDGLPFINIRMNGPFETQRMGEEYAEALARQHMHGEGEKRDADDHPTWEPQ